MIIRLRVTLLMIAAAVVVISGRQSFPVNRPWPPGLQSASNESPVLTPAESMQTMFMPPGYRLELVASEPLVQDPVFATWDPNGRLWVVEAPEYMRDILFTGQFDPIGRIVVLEDTNDDGRMDRRTVFADGLVQARSIAILEQGVLVEETPNVWLMRDTNGDLRADAKTLVTDRFGRREASFEHNANGFYWALDNRMYTANSDVYFRETASGAIETLSTLDRGQWGVTQDDAGRIFRATNENVLHLDFVPTPYYARHPRLLRTRGSYESMSGENGEENVVWPVRPTRGVNRGYQTGVLRDDGRLARFTSSTAPTIYRGDRLPSDLYGNVFVAEPAGNTVSRLTLTDTGTTLVAHKAYPDAEFLSATDERFRPVNLTNAPDGTLYIVDMYRGIVQQRSDITEYLRDQILSRRLEQPIGLGRIYRVMHETTTRAPKPALSTMTAAQLVGVLSHPNGWYRDTAQRMLVERRDRSVVPALVSIVESGAPSRTRLEALWVLDALDAIEPALVAKTLEDPDRDVRASSIRIAERWLGEPNHPIQTAVLKRLDDADWSVRHQLAASIGAMAPGAKEAAAVAFLERNAGDPIAMDATLSGLRGSEVAVLDRLLQTDAQTQAREDAIVMLTALVIRGGQDAAIQSTFARVADERRPGWQRAALLRGAEVALAGAQMPGTPARRGGPGPLAANAPCPTCPGARGGPGGDRAFPGGPEAAASRFVNPFVAPPQASEGPATNATTQAGQPAPPARGGRAGGAAGAAGGGGRGGQTLRLSREPQPLATVAASNGPFAERAASLLRRIEWPGKPGVAAPVAPLTGADLRRFEAGENIYKSTCQACHQIDGRGQDRIAASLIGSPLALASPDVPIRILLNGKEGTIGLMPPLGQTMSDDEIASVLTYIRREWGQTGAPVDPATVKDVRARNAERKRPWTNDELLPGTTR
jgi:mono/diheme cytochrome c family protein/glucose/arabinose dehydrogenase